MAEESRGEHTGASSEHVADAPAWAALSAASREKADAFLDRQTHLVDLQARELELELHLRHWSLRVRHVSDVLKLGFEFTVGLIVLAIVVGFGALIWSASHADGLVIDAIRVPPSMAARGLTGDVVASKLLDRLTALQDATTSSRAASTFAHDWTNDIKVEIPDTGVSFGEAMRYLDAALGHQTHLSGEMYETAKGITLTVRLDNESGQTFVGSPDDLEGVVQQASEAMFGRAQPYRYGIYLSENGRTNESVAILRGLAQGNSGADAAWANIALSYRAADADRNADATALANRAFLIDPNLPNYYGALRNVAVNLGHDEDLLVNERNEVKFLGGSGATEWSQSSIARSQHTSAAVADSMQGDYRAAFVDLQGSGLEREYGNGLGASYAALAHDAASVNLFGARLFAMRDQPDDALQAEQDSEMALALQALDLGNWSTALAHLDRIAAIARSVEASPPRSAPAVPSARPAMRTFVDPWSAYVYAKLGDEAKADAILKTLPVDCDICSRTRGKIDAARGKWADAAYWFAQVSARAPSIPFADTDWGAMLLHKGDTDSAIAKFEHARDKGPHFADPLEMWGEALMQKNRSDMALAKFEEAGKYAPKWGRLHLKWGEALFFAGKADEAKKQFAIASGLDLSQSDRTSLLNWTKAHG